jgi:large subunit ribosomal protein L17
MRHRVAIRHLSRTASHRIAMRRNMAQSLIQHGAIRTTEPKAKELRRFVEKVITTARRGTLHARRLVISEMGDRMMVDDEGEVQDKTVIQKLFDEIAPRYAERPGGYTRIIRLAERRIGDAGKQVLLQLVEASSAGTAEQEAARSTRRRRRAGKRRERLETAKAAQPAAAPAAEASAPAEPAPQAAGEEKPKE